MLRINIQFFGGRGSGSYSGNASSGGSIMGGGGSGSGQSIPLNVAGWTPDAGHRAVSMDNTVNGVASRIKGLDHEQMAVIDKDGYVVAAVDGGASSVGYTAKALSEAQKDGATTIHNHPNGGTFSGGDILSMGQVGESRMMAVSKRFNTVYTMTKTNKFNGQGLAKAIQRADKKLAAQWDAKIAQINKRKYTSQKTYEHAVYKAYNDVMGDWLSANASKYGYTYSSTKLGK